MIDPPETDLPKRKRRRFQFRLRTLMIGVTLIAVACWVFMDRQRLIAERDHALDQLRSTIKANQDLQSDIYGVRDEWSIKYASLSRIHQKIIDELITLRAKAGNSETSP
jgi:hypothetical protein